MRLFHQFVGGACLVCERPARPFALACDYCGEDLPQRRGRLFLRVAMAGAALFCTCAFAAIRARVPFPATITLPGGVLVALGVGLALLPPSMRGVAGAMRRERWRQVSGRYFGGLALTVLTAMVTLAAGTPRPWSLPHIILAMAACLTLVAAPLALQLPWHKLVAGFLLAAGLLLSH